MTTDKKKFTPGCKKHDVSLVATYSYWPKKKKYMECPKCLAEMVKNAK